MNSLRPFEAAARHQSFKLAAEELHLTPSAISYAVQTLEQWLGGELFTRSSRGLSLNAEGVALLPRVQRALEEISAAAGSFQDRTQGAVLRLSVAPTFCQYWLLPRLVRFRERHPTITLMLDTSHRPLVFARDGVDIAIRMGDGNWPDLYAECLFSESLLAVCSPLVASGIDTVADLERLPLLRVSDVDDDWPAWLAAMELPSVEHFETWQFDSIHSAWLAAAHDLGIAIGRLPLVQPELDSGRLLALLGTPVATRTAYWLTAPEDAMRRPEMQCFRQWLFDEIAGVAGKAGSQEPE